MNKIYNAPLCSFYSMCTTSNLMNDDFPVLDKKTAICENKFISQTLLFRERTCVKKIYQLIKVNISLSISVIRIYTTCPLKMQVAITQFCLQACEKILLVGCGNGVLLFADTGERLQCVMQNFLAVHIFLSHVQQFYFFDENHAN